MLTTILFRLGIYDYLQEYEFENIHNTNVELTE